MPLLLIEPVSVVEMKRMLPVARTRYATVRELLAFYDQNRKAALRHIGRDGYRVVALGSDDFDPLGEAVAFLAREGHKIVLDRVKSTRDEPWGPKDLILLRYPSRLA